MNPPQTKQMKSPQSNRKTLSRLERDILRLQIFYLIDVIEYMAQQNNQLEEEALHEKNTIAHDTLCRKIRKFIDDYRSNNERSYDLLRINYWENQLAHYDEKTSKPPTLVPSGRRECLAITDGVARTASLITNAVQIPFSLFVKFAFIAGGALSTLAEQSESLNKSLGLATFVLSAVIQSLLLLNDVIALCVDRATSPNKKLLAKLIEDGRWRRMLKSAIYLSFTLTSLLCGFDLITACLVSSATILLVGMVDLGHYIYETKKVTILHARLMLKHEKMEVDSPKASNEGFLEQSSYQLSQKMCAQSHKKIVYRRTKIIRSASLTLLGIGSVCLLTLGASSLACILTGAILSVLFIVLQVYFARRRIGAVPRNIKKVLLRTKDEMAYRKGNTKKGTSIDLTAMRQSVTLAPSR